MVLAFPAVGGQLLKTLQIYGKGSKPIKAQLLKQGKLALATFLRVRRVRISIRSSTARALLARYGRYGAV